MVILMRRTLFLCLITACTIVCGQLVINVKNQVTTYTLLVTFCLFSVRGR